MDYDKIIAALEEAENTVATLKELLTEDKDRPDRDRDRDQSVTSSNLGGSSSAFRGSDGTGIFSKDQLYYTKYMTLSAVKLFEERGEQVFRIADSVGLYFIVPGSKVRTAARSAVLRIVRIGDDYRVNETYPPAFLQVGDWIYPLMPGSLAYRSEDKYYLFPDLTSQSPGASVGVVLPKTADRDEFERLMLGFLAMDEFQPQPPSFGKSTELILSARTSVSLIRTGSGVYSQRNSTASFNPTIGPGSGPKGFGDGSFGKRIGDGIKAGGELISRGFEYGAKGTAEVIGCGASCLTSKLPKEEDEREIPELVVDAVVYARDVTGRAVNLSTTLLNMLGQYTSCLASLTACWVKNATIPLVNKCADCAGVSQEALDAVTAEVKNVGEGVIAGVAEAYIGLEHAAKILADALSTNTVDVVTHCYGKSAATILVGASHVVGNITTAGINTTCMTDTRTHLKKTVQKTGLALALEECKAK